MYSPLILAPVTANAVSPTPLFQRLFLTLRRFPLFPGK
jgi:hypothetical protein